MRAQVAALGVLLVAAAVVAVVAAGEAAVVGEMAVGALAGC